MQKQALKGVPIQSNAEVQALFGQSDAFLKIIEDDFDVRVVLKSDSIAVIGENVTEVNRVTTVLESLLHRIRKGERIQATDVNYVIRASGVGEQGDLGETGAESIPVFSKRGVIRPKTAGQKGTLKQSNTTTSFSVSDPQEQVKRISLWQWLSPRSKVDR